ncbi:hypothetical protein DY000_02017904 [Brassica cretica]|uniref:Uncharacterized protein n=1 Tax=Brassica cretica TaxID=69181 RepID=A0ABQ7CNK6_BRACR|nr:hypothetical protein DY000_02017904 [Brassica cretica]
MGRERHEELSMMNMPREALFPYDRTQNLDQDVELTQHGDQDDQISPAEVLPFSRARLTDRAVYRIDPRVPGRDLRMDPRPDDRISRTTGVLPRPIRHSRANSQARTHDHREESDSRLSMSFLARLGRTARPDQADHDISNHFDDFMMIDASNYSKGRILKLSEDLGRAISSSCHPSIHQFSIPSDLSSYQPYRKSDPYFGSITLAKASDRAREEEARVTGWRRAG